ncbi:MAG: trypsin-like peptidase domain-containing protein [Nitrososphaerota archaeon]|nr:trypsin-like peptidase domain-containing protein [Candidatus Calditenuaceae archaeon]MDW8073220.1 trypsin-like peptidase domain-containing protein [Nitrososphaerota archaeon]
MSKAAFAVSAVSLAIAALLFLQVMSYQQDLRSLTSQLAGLQAELNSLRRDLQAARAELTELESSPKPQTIVTHQQYNITSVYELVKGSVVEIKTLYRFGESVGSGFVYDSAGHVITNNHVVEGGVEYFVYFIGGAAFRAELVGRDPDTDLAVLRIVTGGEYVTFKPLKLGDSSELRIGEQIIAIGNPFELTGSVTVGIVSQKGRLLQSGRGYLIPGIIQIDAAVNPGNSGGPILNMRGEVVGVATAIESTTGQFSGIGYAVSSNVVKRIVPALISKGTYRHSYLGIAGNEINALVAKEIGLNVSRGLLVETVVPGGPADKAGVRGGLRVVTVAGTQYRVGGDVIVAINGSPVGSMDDLLTYMVERTSPGDTVILTVLRSGEKLDIQVTLGERP